MPVIKSYKKFVCESMGNDAKEFEDDETVVYRIAGNILDESPELVAEAAMDWMSLGEPGAAKERRCPPLKGNRSASGAPNASVGHETEKAVGMTPVEMLRTEIATRSSAADKPGTEKTVKHSPMERLGAEKTTRQPPMERLELVINEDIDRNRYKYRIYREELVRKVVGFMKGYGDLQRYVEDDLITDIDGMRYNQFSVKRQGTRMKIPVNFGCAGNFDTYCRLLIVRNGGIANRMDGYCRATDEKNKLRIRVLRGPGHWSGPAVSIRKHRGDSPGIYDLKMLGMLDDELVSLLKRYTDGRSSVLFCGRSASGKTTLLRAFINVLPEMERVLIAEEDMEIRPDKPFCIEQLTAMPFENDRPATLRELIRDSRNMRLDTYCIGEITGGEACEFIQAIDSGHRGIATMCSDSAWNVLPRLAGLSGDTRGRNIDTDADTDNTYCRQEHALMNNMKEIKRMIGSSIDAIVFLEEFKVVEVLEVQGYQAAQDAYEYRRAYLRPTVYENYNAGLTEK